MEKESTDLGSRRGEAMKTHALAEAGKHNCVRKKEDEKGNEKNNIGHFVYGNCYGIK